MELFRFTLPKIDAYVLMQVDMGESCRETWVPRRDVEASAWDKGELM